MTVGQIFTKIGNFIENRHIFMLLNSNCAKLANFEDFKTCWGGRFFVDTVYITILSGWILHDRLLHTLRSWSWHFLNSDISQGSVVTQLRYGETISQSYVANLLLNLSVKEVWKSVNIWRSYRQYCSALFFLTHSVDLSFPIAFPSLPPTV